MWITFGMIAAFFIFVIIVMERSHCQRRIVLRLRNRWQVIQLHVWNCGVHQHLATRNRLHFIRWVNRG